MTVSARRADPVDRAADPATPASGEERQPRASAPMPVVVMPQVRQPSALSGGKTVHELHSLIEEAMGLLAKERENEAAARPVDEAPAGKRVLGAPPGSEIRYPSSLASRVFKMVVGLAVAFIAGVVPLKGILTPSSTEAFVNAPLYTLRAPIDGQFVSDKLIVGAPVAPGERLGEIVRTDGAGGNVPVAVGNAGKIWEVLAPAGANVAPGDEIARVVACSAASVTAAVPEGLKEYVTQRGRWCLGFMQIVRGPSGPFSLRRRIGLIQRLSLLEALTNWSFVYMYKVGGILVPIIYLLGGVKAVQVSLLEMLAYFLPYYVVHSLTMSWISQGRVVPIMTDVCQLLTAPPALKVVAIGLLRPRGHKFSVTAKGGDRQKRFVEWPLLRIFLTLLLLADTSVVFAFALSDRHVPIDEGALALFWSWYNIAALTLLCFICVEQPRRRRAGRFATQERTAIYGNGDQQLFWMRDISASGARFGGKAPVGKGEALLIRIGDNYLHATVVRASDRDFAVRFESSLRARGALVRHIYSAMHERVIRQVRIGPIARALMLRLMK